MDVMNGLLPFLTGAIFILSGIIMLRFPPKKINELYGYRSARAMQSQLHWDFAQRYSAKYFIRIGVLSLCMGLIISLLTISKTWALFLGFVILFSLIGMLIYATEQKLKNIKDP